MKYIVLPTTAGSVKAPGFDPTQQYVIASAHSTKVLTVDDGRNVIQRSWDESNSQLWKFRAAPGNNQGYLEIVNVGKNYPLSIASASRAEGAALFIWPDHSGNDQHFKVQLLTNDRYRLLNQNSDLVAAVSGQSLSDGAKIIQQKWTNASTQQWSIMTVSDYRQGQGFAAYATLYEHRNYGGTRQNLGIGAYDLHALTIGNDVVSSLKVPDGLRVTLYEDQNFRGSKRQYTSDTDWVGDDFNDKTSGVLVEQIATVYRDPNYSGEKQELGIGSYRLKDLSLGNDQISSLKVPQGLMVTLYEDENFKGKFNIFTHDHPDLRKDGLLNDKTSSIKIKAVGVFMPVGSLKFGDKVILQNTHTQKLLMDKAGGGVSIEGNLSDGILESEQFTLVRSGHTKSKSYLSFGDVISLKDKYNHYLEATPDGKFKASNATLTDAAKLVLVRSGKSMHNNFVSPGDIIAFKTYRGNFMQSRGSEVVQSTKGNVIGAEAKFLIKTREKTTAISPQTHHHTPTETSVCGAEACAVDECGAAACGVAVGGLAACGIAAEGLSICGADFAAISVCGAAASAAGICGADIGGATVSGVSAGGVGVCSADACGAAGCGAAACGAAACGAAACGADACGGAASLVGAELANACGVDVATVEANVVDVCSAEASIVDVSIVDLCAANACAINLCPIDACAADACAIDIIPIVPFI